MKVLKRLLCGALIAVLLFPAAIAAPSESSFPDTQGHWAQEQIEAAVQSGWVSGYPDGTFRPDATVTRAEFVKMLLSATKMTPEYFRVQWMESKNKTNLGPLNDMANHWMTKQGFTDAALGTGIIVVDDYNGHNFRPEKAIARYEIALMADRALGLVYPATHEENLDLSFTDKSSIQDWMLGYIKEATDLGILKGYPDGSFGPQKTATRAEAVAIISRVLNEMNKGFNKSSLSFVCEYNSLYPPHALRVIRNLDDLDIDGTIYVSARVLLQTWELLYTDWDCYGVYDDSLQWDPISQCLSITLNGYDRTNIYPGSQGCNFNIGAIFDTDHEMLRHLAAPTRMVYGEVMIPVYSSTENAGWRSTYENHTLTMILPEAADPPIS